MTRRAAALALALIAGAALAAASVVRIPDGAVGLAARRVLEPGWHLRLPLAHVERSANPAVLEVGPISGTTAEGAARQIGLRLSLRLTEADLDREFLRAASADGLAPALAARLTTAFAAALRAGDIARLGRMGTDTDDFGHGLAESLEGLGISVEDLSWRRVDATPGPPVAPLRHAGRPRILLVGVDSADWQVAAPLVQAGRMPSLSRLVREGTSGPLRSYDPMISPLVWTTMVTGTGPDVHGIADFTVTDGARGKRVPIGSDYRRVKALWNIYSDAGVTSSWIGWWASHPAEVVRGAMVTELLGFQMMNPGAAAAKGGGITYPADYYDRIRPRLILPAQVSYEEVRRFLHVSRSAFDAAVDVSPPETPVPGAKPFAVDPVWLVRKTIAVTRNYETVALDRLQTGDDVVAVYFEGADILSHRFMHCAPPQTGLCPDADYAEQSRVVDAFYEYQDEVLGRLMDAAAGRAVIVVSDHGFRNGADRPGDYLPYTTGQPVEWHREYGLIVLAGPGIRTGAALRDASVFDVAPTLLHLQGLPIGADMRGRVLTGAIDPGGPAAEGVRTVPTYEEMGTPLVAISGVREAPSPEAEAEMLRNLQALGYVGGAPAAAAAPAAGAPAGAQAAGEGAGQPNTGAGAAGTETASRVTYHRNMATFLLKEGRLDEAERELEKANRITKLPKTYEMISQIRAQRGDVEGAVAVLEDGLRALHEMDEEAALYIVELRLGQRRADLADAAYREWGARVRRPAIRSLCEGRLAQARGDTEGAIAALSAALREEPDLSQAAVALAPLLAERGRLGELEAPVRAALDRESRLDEYQNLLGLILLDRGDGAGALVCLGRALDVAPANSRFLENMAAAALGAGAPDAALDRYRRAVEDPRAAAEVWAGYGRLLGALRRHAEAAAAFERALAAGDRAAETYAGAAAATAAAGQRARAADLVREGLKTHPGDPALTQLQRSLSSPRG